MVSSAQPSDAPPAYDDAVGRQQSSPRRAQAGSTLDVPEDERSTLTPEDRRSFEDEMRPLPEGWIRCWDKASKHQVRYAWSSTDPLGVLMPLQYFVDTATGASDEGLFRGICLIRSRPEHLGAPGARIVRREVTSIADSRRRKTTSSSKTRGTSAKAGMASLPTPQRSTRTASVASSKRQRTR
jgi:hypothetical protein